MRTVLVRCSNNLNLLTLKQQVCPRASLTPATSGAAAMLMRPASVSTTTTTCRCGRNHTLALARAAACPATRLRAAAAATAAGGAAAPMAQLDALPRTANGAHFMHASHLSASSATRRAPPRVVVAATSGGGPSSKDDGGGSVLQRLGTLAAAAAIFLGGFGTGLASSDLATDVRSAETTREQQQQALEQQQPLQAPHPVGRLPVRQASLVLPDKVAQDQLAAAKQAGLAPDELSTIRVFQANTPSVVNITNIQAMRGYYSMDVEKIPAGTGSGFVWDQQGHIVTNFHVIRGASEVKVTLLDKSSYSAKVVGAEPDKDVAVLQLVGMPPDQMAGLQPVTLGASSNLLVGQRVFAIGNPFGLDHTLTQGIISGLGREIGSTGLLPIKDVIQTDAAINPGNSGGVLLDSQGRLIGINTAIADPTGKGASSGVGFAIPVDSVRGLVEQILQFGRVMRPSLGIVIAPPQALQRVGERGVLVLDVTPGSPAERAGLQPTRRNAAGELLLGDIVKSIDGREVSDVRELLEQLDARRVGDKVAVEVQRGAQRLRFSITLADRAPGLGTE